MKGYLNNLRPFERRLVVAVGVMVFIVLNFAFVFPHFSDWGKMQTRKASAEQTLQKFMGDIQQTNQIGKEIAILENQGAVPPEDQASEFSRTVQVLASQYHVNIINFNRMTDTIKPYFIEKSLPLSLAAKEEDLVEFLYNLGAQNSLIRVRGLTVRPDQPRQNLSVNVTVVASYQKKPPVRGTAPVRSGSPSAQPVSAAATKATPISK